MVLEKFHECWLCDYYIVKTTKGERVKPWCCWHDKEINPNGLCKQYTRYEINRSITKI